MRAVKITLKECFVFRTISGWERSEGYYKADELLKNIMSN
jgi:hypothetical protein